MPAIVVEGWRFIPHSYAMVCQHFCLELARRPEVRLFFRDMPFPSTFPASDGLWTAEQERALRALPAPSGDDPDAIVLRFDWPHRLIADPVAARTFVWGTTEFKLVEAPSIAVGREPGDAFVDLECRIIACSRWAAQGILNAGAASDSVSVVPCGADTDTFYPLTAPEREALRTELCWSGRFVVLNVSAMTGNKGIPLLLKAVAQAAARHPQLLVALKGVDEMYGSSRSVHAAVATLSPAEQNRMRDRIWYAGGALSTRRIAQLMQAADAYISPYFAEGFNMPVLEAAACGLPVVCTRGGPTDEFTHEDFALRINSFERREADGRTLLRPNPVHLAEHLERVITDGVFRARAAQRGPEWVRERFRWRHATDRLLRVLLRS